MRDEQDGHIVDSSSTQTQTSREGVKEDEHMREKRRKELNSKLRRMIMILNEYTRLKYMESL